MTPVVRARDCVLFFKGDSQTVRVSPTLAAGGWPGGQGVMWAPSGGVDDRTVTYSNGLYGGFLLWGSDEPGDDFAASTRNQPHYQFATMLSGGCLMSTSSYERFTYASRLAGGPFVPLVYQAQQILYLSRRGLWTNEEEMTLAGDPKAPAFFAGFVAQAPTPGNRHFLGVQTSM